MESADSPARHCDEQTGEDGLTVETGGRPPVLQSIPEFRNRRPLGEQTDAQGHSHKQNREGEKRIYSSYQLVNRNDGGNQIVNENASSPYEGRFGRSSEHIGHFAQNQCRTVNEDSPHQNQKQYSEQQHHPSGSVSQIFSHQFRDSGASFPNGHHSGQIVVHRSCENRTQYHPQIAGRPETCSHYRTENRSSTGDVEELNHKHLPGGHRHIVHSVRPTVGRCNSGRIGTEQPFHDSAVDDVSENQGCNAYQK